MTLRKAIASIGSVVLTMCSLAAEPITFSFREPGILKMGRQRFDLTDAAEQRSLVQAVEKLQVTGSSANLPKKDLRGASEIVRRIELFASSTNNAQCDELPAVDGLQGVITTGRSSRNRSRRYRQGVPRAKWLFSKS
jgi:hypothetical protein